MLHVIGPALEIGPALSGALLQSNPSVQSLMFTSADGSELTGKTLVTEEHGTIVCAAGSMACNAALTLVKQFDGTDSAAGWVTTKDTREA